MGLFSNLFGNAGVVDPEKLENDYKHLLIEGEHIDIGFNIFRDIFMFTNKRLILIDKQGLTGSKTEYLSIAYKSITRFSVETAGTFDMDSELKIWVSSEKTPSIEKKLDRKVNVFDVQNVLAMHVL